MTLLTSLTIRRATEADLPSIYRMEQASFADPWDEDAITAALTLPHMQTWVAERGDHVSRELVGFVIGLMLGAEAEVADLAVSPAMRGQGVGGFLLDFLLAGAAREGVASVFLEVRESNVAARALYVSRAFREVGRRRGYYRQPVEDALLLRRDLVPT
jgi:ribosomal-protein-alanine N-acetyltransferase